MQWEIKRELLHFSLCDWQTIRTNLEILWKFAVRYSLQISLPILPVLAIIVPHQESFRLASNVFQIGPFFSFPQLLSKIPIEVFYSTVHPWLAWCDKHGLDAEMEAQPHDTAEMP